MQMKRKRTATIITLATICAIGIIILLIAAGLYLFRTTDVSVQGSLLVGNPKIYVDNGLLVDKTYLQYSAIPTETTKPDTAYRITANNGVLEYENKLIWSPVELDIRKAKIIKHALSSDEFAAIQKHPFFATTITEIRSEHNGNYLLLPLLYGAAIVLAAMLIKDKRQQPIPQPAKQTTIPEPEPAFSEQDLVKRCLQCSSLKTVHGLFKCQRETCKYESKISEQISSVSPQPNPIPLPHHSKAIPQVFGMGLLTFCAGGWAMIFLSIIDNGSISMIEPSKAMIWGEFGFATALTLAGIVMTVIKLKDI